MTTDIQGVERGASAEGGNVLAADLRQRAEEIAANMAAPAPGSLPAEEVGQLVHDLHVQRIAVELYHDELRRMQGALDRQHARFQDLYDLAPLGYLTVSEAGLILEANTRAATLLGVARDSLTRQPLSRFILPEDQDIYFNQRRQLLVTGEAQNCELRLQPENGLPFLARLQVVVAPGQELGASAFRMMVSDITVGKEMETALWESTATLAAILEASPDSVIIIDTKGKIVTSNPAAAAGFGREGQELIGTSVYGLLPKTLAASRKARIEVAVNSRNALSFQDEYQGRIHATTIFPLCAASGKVVRVIVLTRDISERVAAERLIAQGQEGIRQQVLERTATLTEMMAGLRREVEEQALALTCLRDRERELEELVQVLQGANDVLTNLLRRRDQDKQGVRDELLTALKKKVLPAVARLKRSGLTERQSRQLQTVEANLGAIISPSGRTGQAVATNNLTGMEMEVATLVKQGKKTQEIATQLHISPRTVESHRNKIRQKMGIASRKVTLRQHLQTP